MDYYDKAVAYFKEHPERIENAWFAPNEAPFGKLFSFCDKTRQGLSQCQDRKPCGCPVMIRDSPENYSAQTPEIRQLVLDCAGLPRTDEINERAVPYLEAFAAIQRRIDAELGRTPPVWVKSEA